MADSFSDLKKLLSTSTEDRLADYIRMRVDARLSELQDRRKALGEELAAIEYELELLRRYRAGGVEQDATVQDLLAKLLTR